MGAFFDEIPESLIEWIKEQKLFFVATAPRADSGHVNVSPKGHDTFHVVSKTRCVHETAPANGWSGLTVDSHFSAWYLDLTGSGNETISHLQENGRITISEFERSSVSYPLWFALTRSIVAVFAALTGPPRIMRLFGTGRVIERGTRQFDELLANEPERLTSYSGQRSIIWIDIHKVGTSCGYSVPFFEYKSERDTLLKFMQKREDSDAAGREDDGMRAYWKKKNSESMDGLPGYRIQPASLTTSSHPLRVFDAAVGKVATTTKGSLAFVTGLMVGLLTGMIAFVFLRDIVEPRLGLA
ncbi:hypothetical protein OIV83_005484 [Microbotryomycetes sp. JL201]|nr:hypothetical protein OIV83_005484 [Microbotryomycetes sp. JL201]